MDRGVRGFNAGSCSTIMSCAKPQAQSETLVFWLYSCGEAHHESQQMSAFHTRVVNLRFKTASLSLPPLCLLPALAFKQLSRCKIPWDNLQMPGRSAGGEKIRGEETGWRKAGSKGLLFVPQTASLNGAPLSPLSPDVLSTRGREQSVSKMEHWEKNKPKPDKRGDSWGKKQGL